MYTISVWCQWDGFLLPSSSYAIDHLVVHPSLGAIHILREKGYSDLLSALLHSKEAVGIWWGGDFYTESHWLSAPH